MKKNNYIKVISFVLCFVMLFAMSTLFAGAKDKSEEEYTPITWKMDENADYLYGDNKRFDRYYVRGAFYIDSEFSFYFKNKVDYDGRLCQVYGDSSDPHIVLVKYETGYSYVFADSKGKAILDSFVNRTECVYYLEDFNKTYTGINKELIDYLDEEYYNNVYNIDWVAVNELKSAKIYEITGHDKTKMVAYQHGAIYVMPNGVYYYVCFEDLDNSYFDADGYFSYRSGNVWVYELDNMTRKSINNAINDMSPQEHKKIYESDVIAGFYDIYGNPIDSSDELDDPDFRLASIISFYVIAIIAGIIIPAVLFVVGLVLARPKKTGRVKCWYALSAATGIWILCAALFLLIVTL